MRRAGPLVLFVALGLGIAPHAACSSDPEPAPSRPLPDVIEIGSLVAQSGDLAGTGKDNTESANLAVEQINAAGGVLGRPIKLIVEDDRTTVDGARNGYGALVSRKVAAVIGPSSSAQVVAVADLIAASRTVTIGRTSTSPLLTTIADDDFFFRVAPADTFQAKVLSRLVRDAQLEKICLVNRDDTYGSRLADALASELASAPLTITRASYNPSTKDLSQVLSACDALRCSADGGAPDGGGASCAPDAKVGLVMVTFVSDGAAILAGRPEWSASKQRFFFTDGARDTELLKLGLPQERLQGAIGTIPSGPDPAAPDGTLLSDYRTAFQARYDAPPPAFSQNAFEAAYLLATAIELAGTIDGRAIRDALRRTSTPGGTPVSAGKWQAIREAIAKKEPIDYRGVTGEADFDENGDLRPPYYYRVWRIDGGQSLTDKIERVAE